jgi:hypothetical protein
MYILRQLLFFVVSTNEIFFMIKRPLTSNNNNIVQILFTTVLGFSILTQSFWTKTKNIERTHDTDWMKELTNLSTKLWKRFFCIINPTSTKAKIKERLLVLFILFIYFYFYYYFVFALLFHQTGDSLTHQTAIKRLSRRPPSGQSDR